MKANKKKKKGEGLQFRHVVYMSITILVIFMLTGLGWMFEPQQTNTSVVKPVQQVKTTETSATFTLIQYIQHGFNSFGFTFPKLPSSIGGKVLIVLARLLSIGVTIYLILFTLLSDLRVRFKRIYFAYCKGNKILVYGDGPIALRLLELYHEEGRNVAWLAYSLDEALLQFCSENGIPFFSTSNNFTLQNRHSLIRRAEQLYLVTEEDTQNIDAIIKLKAFLKQEDQEQKSGFDSWFKHPFGLLKQKKLNCYIHCKQQNLRQLFIQHTVFNVQNETLELIPLDLYQMAARKLLQDHPIDPYAHNITQGKEGEEKTPHLILAGMGTMGRHVLLQALQIGHYPNNQKLHISCIDKLPQGNKEAILSSYPNIEQCGNLTFHEMSIDSIEFITYVEDSIKDTNKNTMVVIAPRDDVHGFNAAVQLRQKLGRSYPDFTICVHIAQLGVLSSVVEQLRNKANTYLSDGIYTFGLDSVLHSVQYLEEKEYDLIAREVHEVYREEAIRKREEFIPKPWETLEETYRVANRHTADHVRYKLRSLGIDLPEKGEDIEAYKGKIKECINQFVRKIDNTEILITLSDVEHERWMACRYLDGWVGPEMVEIHVLENFLRENKKPLNEELTKLEHIYLCCDNQEKTEKIKDGLKTIASLFFNQNCRNNKHKVHHLMVPSVANELDIQTKGGLELLNPHRTKLKSRVHSLLTQFERAITNGNSKQEDLRKTFESFSASIQKEYASLSPEETFLSSLPADERMKDVENMIETWRFLLILGHLDKNSFQEIEQKIETLKKRMESELKKREKHYSDII